MNDKTNKQIKGIAANEWKQLLALFDVLTQLPAVEQVQRLSQEQLSQTAKNLLQKMLASQHQPHVLDTTIDPLVETLLGEDAICVHANPANIIGRTFGAWKAVSALGLGGMGQVFVAERADGQFEKQVALKIIKSGQFSAHSQQRFMDEMRTLAQFEHPHIAHLIDGGSSEEGITYFVMELVDGVPIVAYANAKRLPLAERIKLLLQVIDAVEYAHQSLIIHGDIKPANILVNESGQVKLVDFGIARSLGDESTDNYLPQFSPSYSAPEQVQGQVLTTASDVFGLCAVLYELCTGSSPRNSESKTTQLEFIAHISAPITAAYITFLYNQRHHQLGTLLPSYKTYDQALSQELGAIIDKGLQIAVPKRYKNTTELRRDLLLFLEGAAVPSFATSWLYRCKKSVLKHKWPVVLSMFGLLVLIGVTLVAIKQAQLAQLEANKANWANQFLLSIFDHADPVKNQQNPITVNQLTAQAAEQIMEDDSELLLKTTSLGMLSQIQYKLGEVESAERLITEQINLLQKLPVDDTQLAAVHIKAGNIMEAQDKLVEAIDHYRQALQLVPITAHFTESSVRASLALANSLLRLNELDETRQLMTTLVGKTVQIEALPAADSVLSTLYAVKANLLLSAQQFEAAIAQLQEAKVMALRVAGEPLLYPHILSLESDAYYESGQLIQAAEIDRELVEYFSHHFGEDHPETIDKLGRLAVSLAGMGDLQAAITINQKIIANLKGTEIKGHQIPAAYLNMGTAYQALGDDKTAIENYTQAQKLWPQLKPRIVIYEATTEVRIAQSLLNLKQYDEAQKYFASALARIEKEYGVDHGLFARFQIMYVPLLLELGRAEEANAIIPAAYQRMVIVYGEHSKNAAVAKLRWAQLNVLLNHPEVAAEQAASVIEVLDVDAYRKRNQELIDLAQQISQMADQ